MSPPQQYPVPVIAPAAADDTRNDIINAIAFAKNALANDPDDPDLQKDLRLAKLRAVFFNTRFGVVQILP